jgi:Ca-activated chloride channel family protein
MRFAEPSWLLVGAVAVVLLVFLRVRSETLTSRAMKALAGAHLVAQSAFPSRFRRWLRVVVITLAVAMAFVALARPQKGMRWQTVDRKGTDVLLVVDTSKSMDADDVRPTRLERTKLAVRDLVERFPADRIGLVAFAGDAFVESPLTLDHEALLETLGDFDTSIIARGGTDLGHAIDVGAAALKADSDNQKVMVLLTDGEDLESGGLDAARRAAEAGVTIETVGVGTPAGELVPSRDDHGVTVGLVHDESGAPVRSRLDEPGLRAIAQAAHGTYRSLGADGRGLDRLYDEVLAPLAHTEKGARTTRVYAEWFAVPLALSVFGVVLDSLLGWRPRSRSRTRRSASGRSVLRAGALAAAASMLLLPAQARASVHDAEKAYAAGKFEDAAHAYQAAHAADPKDTRLTIDAAAAAYRAGHYDAAEAAYDQALKSADPKLQQRVLYDLGDARYRLGESTLAKAPDETREHWKAAITAYDGALALTPSDADATYNRDFVKRKLAELDKKQPPQPKDSQAKKDGDGQGSKGEAGKSGPSGKSDAAKGENGAAAKNGGAKDKAPGGAAPPKEAQAGRDQPQNSSPGQQASAGKPGAQPGQSPGNEPSPDGKLTPQEARALLGSLRGDERRGVTSAQSGTAAAPTEPPRKDW